MEYIGEDGLEYVPWDEMPPQAADDELADEAEARRAQGAEKKQKTPSELERTDLADLFGPEGRLAELLDGYEMRPSQLEMAEAVKRALLAQRHALIEAPTGTGKSIAYLIPALLHGKTVVVATANKALQSQLYHKDIPFLSRVLDQKINAVIVKGRSNFLCTYKWEQESFEQQRFAFEDREHEQITFMRKWLAETETGDVDELPFMLQSDLRPRVVSFPDDCLHTDCRFYTDDCWINKMRDRAGEARVLITNHHLLLNALELGWAGERILPSAAVYIIDEAHQLEGTATSVFEASVTDYTVEQLLSRNVFKEHVDNDELDSLRFQNTLAFQEVAHLNRDNAFRIDGDLESMKKLASALHELSQRMRRDNPFGQQASNSFDDEAAAHGMVDPGASGARPKAANDDDGEARRAYELALEGLTGTVSKLQAIANSGRDEDYVRYAVRVFDRRHITIELHAAPINPADLLHEFLFHPDLADSPAEDEPEGGEIAGQRTVIATSATLATNRHFEHFKARCGIAETGEELVLPAVFDYPKQALLYQPALPAYNWRNADRFYAAAAGEISRLLEISRGRALCLFTSWSGLQQVREQLREPERTPIWPLRAQGEAPRDALLTWFKETPHSVLLATKSFWEGVDIPGDDLSLVVLDKMPFPTPGDPLHSARMKNIDEDGRSSFGEYMLPLMTLTLKQGFGRLVRRGSDSGVVAILDERLTSKGYGRQARQDLPPARFSRNFRDVHGFFRTALDSQADFAVNVWAAAVGVDDAEEFDFLHGDEIGDEPGDIYWRWQMLRLQDGKADDATGVERDLPSAAAGELHAAVAALRNLHGRIEKAGRTPDGFGVELRCSPDAAALAAETDSRDPLVLTWLAEKSRWKRVEIVELFDTDEDS